jgi:hypothetical protein
MADSNIAAQRVTELSLRMAHQVTDENTISEVFNALGQTVVAFVIDYLVANDKPLNNETVVGELNKFCALASMQAGFILSKSEIHHLHRRIPKFSSLRTIKGETNAEHPLPHQDR